MLALKEYTRRTSFLRVVIVIMTPPVFTAVVILFQESIPLQDPYQGWKASWGFWLRVGVLGIATGYEVITQVPLLLNLPRLSPRQIAVYSIFTGFGLVFGDMALAEIWVFPLPFFLLSSFLVLPVVQVGLMRAVAGKSMFNLITSRKKELVHLNNVAILETLMCAGYPAYQTLFTKVNGTKYELPVTLILAVIKVVMQRLLRFAARHDEDMVPKQVVFNVDFFGAYCLATFLQRLTPTTLAAVMVVDVAESAVELHELYRRARRIRAQLNEVAETKRENKNLLEVTGYLLHDMVSIQKKIHVDFRVRSYITHQLSTESRILLENLDEALAIGNTRQNAHISAKVSVQSFSVVPLPGKPDSLRTSSSPLSAIVISNSHDSIPADAKEPRTLSLRPADTTTAIINETLEILFTSECLVLTEYVEIIIPHMYGLFILVTVHLPSAVYHSKMEGVTLDNVGGMVSQLYVYALLEFVSLLILAVILKRNSGINVLYQLAFVLETEIAFVPSKLILWILYTMTYRVTHFGPDFTFQFEWIKHRPGE